MTEAAWTPMATMSRGKLNMGEAIEVAQKFADTMGYEVEPGSVKIEPAPDLGSGPRTKIAFRARAT